MSAVQIYGRVIYLSHPLAGAGLADPWDSYVRNTSRVRCIAARLEADGAEVRYPHGRIPVALHPAEVEAWVLRGLRRRLIGGDAPFGGDGGFGPHDPGRLPARPQAGAVWVVGPRCADVAEDVALARELGVQIVEVSPADQVPLYEAGSRVLQPLWSPIEDSSTRPDFAAARSVVTAYFEGMEAVCGAPAIDPARQAVRATGNPHGVMGRIAEATARVAASAAVMARARADRRWRPEFLPLLRLLVVEGQTLRRSALAVGWPDDEKGEKKAARARAKALHLVAVAMRRRTESATRGEAP